MIKFFRKIRYQLLGEGKTGKYLKYAIGEIILVMIGILLALQVNSWNQSRLNRLEEKKILANLNDEFVANKLVLQKNIESYTNALNSNIILLNLIGNEPEQLEKHNLDSLFNESFAVADFTFSDKSIANIIQSGQLNIIKNKELIKLIYQWDIKKQLIKEREEKVDDWISKQAVNYLLDYISFKEMDNYGDFKWSGPSKLKEKPNYSLLFQQLKFENLLDNTCFFYTISIRVQVEADSIVSEIIKVTRPYKK